MLPCALFGQIGIKTSKPAQTVDLFEEELFGWQKYQIDSTFFQYDRKISLYKRTVSFDSAGKFVSIQEKIDDTEFYFPAVVDLETYVNSYLRFNARQLFTKKTVEFIAGLKEKEFGAIKLDIPLRIQNETFKRIFGSDRISLRVTGNISFDISGRSEERGGQSVSAQESRNTFSPRFNQTQQFTVEGKIGEKVTVSVEQNSEATTDIENTLKLRYDGEEDEIIQSIEAGNISLSLPSTKYVIFGGSNQGLFGLKTQMKLGNLHVTAIASLERGQQQQLTISGGSSTSKTIIKDINYLKNQFFFIDEVYHDTWDQNFKDPSFQSYSEFRPREDLIINEIDVWVTSQETAEGVRTGVAFLDPNDPTDTDGYKGNFRALNETEYTLDRGAGIIRVNQPIGKESALAVSYTTNTKSVGDLSNVVSDSVRIKLIKEYQQSDPASPYWKLNLKNVYSLGGSDIQKEGFKLEIYQDRNEEIVQGDLTFLTLLGLDIFGPDGTGNSDGEFDLSWEFIDYANGYLIFPDLTPFQPSSSDFKGLLDTAAIYNVTNEQERINQSKYRIEVESSSTKTTFDLGFYVLEGSEVVTLNGKDLVRDKDYSIDYFSGQLSLISEEALRSSSQIDIKYERANLFQLDKKTILGGRAEYKFLDNSFIGATALYLNKTTVDTRVRIGQEPFQNFVWDINAAFKFKPRFLQK